MKNSESRSKIFSKKAKESFTVCSWLVKEFRDFVNLQVGVLITGKIGQKGWQLSMIHLRILPSPYIIPGLNPAGLRDSLFLQIYY